VCVTEATVEGLSVRRSKVATNGGMTSVIA
jgi:hypothetical protein